MKTLAGSFLKVEFESRIFISLGIVALAGTASALSGLAPTFVSIGNAVGIPPGSSATLWYTTLALVFLGVSVLRIWAGSILTPERVMAFEVQVDALKVTGPYRIVRNPIYLADYVGICAFSLCLPPPALVIPALFYVHYHNLIRYEEQSLGVRFGGNYERFFNAIPRLIPRIIPPAGWRNMMSEFRISRAGIRHNALFILLVPGFLVAAVTHNLLHAVVIGLPGVIDWAVIHTKIGLPKKG